MVADTGFEPVTSTVYKKHKIWSKFGHIFRIKNSRLNCLGWNIKKRWTQNPVHFTVSVGSTPSFSIKIAPGILWLSTIYGCFMKIPTKSTFIQFSSILFYF